MRHRFFAMLLAGVFLAQPAAAQYIGIFTAPDAASCGAIPGATPWIDLHIVAVLGGSVTQLTGAQFKITGVPEGWTTQNALWVPEPTSAISLGHPLFATAIHPSTPGVNVAFHECQSRPSGGTVLLGRIVLLGAPTPENVHLRVTGFQLFPEEPLNPFVLICDAPMYSKAVVGGGEFVLNGPQPLNCAGTTAVVPSTWSSVKQLFD
jgi:hypothetical protein